MEGKHINFKKLDSFIQNCLDKYFYVEPWKKLYERTGSLHKDIISDKSTIPDLIIYNKTFNKSFCFFDSNPYSFVKFPRKRFILRPKFRKEYNPNDTYGKNDEIIFYKEDKKNIYNPDANNNNEIKIQEHNIVKELNIKGDNNLEKLKQIQNIEKSKIIEIQNINSSDKKNFPLNTSQNEEEEEEEDEPEWANDNVKEFMDEEIQFKEIPKSLEEKVNKDIESNLNSNAEDKILVPEEENKININIDNFFSEEDNNLKEIENKNKYNTSLESMNNFSKSKNNNEFNNLGKNININKTTSNEFFDIFDTENKFKNLYLEDDEGSSGNNNSSEDIESDKNDKNTKNIFKDNNLQKKNQMRSMNNIKKNNPNNNINYTNFTNNNIYNQLMYLRNNPNFFNNNQRFMNGSNVYNIYNNNNFNFVNLSNLNNNLFNNTNISPNNHSSNIRNFNNPYYLINNFPNSNVPNIDINKKELYVKNLNNMIQRQNMQNNLKYNMMNNSSSKIYNIYNNNIIPINNNIPIRNIFVNNNINNINNKSTSIKNDGGKNNSKNKFDMDNAKQNNINNINNHKKNDDIKDSNNNNHQENLKQGLNPLDFIDNPTQILLKNYDSKKWIVYEKDKSNYIRNFNTPELYEYLKEKEGEESLKDLTIIDSDTDYFFPTNEIYENLKKFNL